MDTHTAGNNVDIASLWQDLVDETREVTSDMQPEIDNSRILDDQTDQVRKDLDNIMDKFKEKNDIYEECKKKRTDKEEMLANYASLLDRTSKQLDATES